jgi:hypothetical protein
MVRSGGTEWLMEISGDEPELHVRDSGGHSCIRPGHGYWQVVRNGHEVGKVPARMEDDDLKAATADLFRVARAIFPQIHLSL